MKSDKISRDVIEDCNISGRGQTGLLVSGTGVSISRVELLNTIIGMDFEVHNSTLSFISIVNSTYAGIELTGTYNDLNNITIRSSGTGVTLHNTSGNIISYSAFENNTNGIQLTILSLDTTVQHCQFLNNSEYGIQTEITRFYDQGNEFRDNIFKDNGKGSISSIPEYENEKDSELMGISVDENFYYYLIMIIVCGAVILLLVMIRSPKGKTPISSSTPTRSAPPPPPSATDPPGKNIGSL